MKSKKLPLIASALLLSACEQATTVTDSTGGKPASSKYVTTIKNCDIYSIDVVGGPDIYLSKCFDVENSSVGWTVPNGKSHLDTGTGNVTNTQTISREQYEQELKQKALEKLTLEERNLLNLPRTTD